MGRLEKLIECAVHLMVVSVLQGLHSNTFNFELSLCLDSSLIVVYISYGFIEAYLEFFGKSEDVASENGNCFRSWAFRCFLLFLLL